MSKKSFIRIFKIVFILIAFSINFSSFTSATNVNIDLTVASKILSISEDDLKRKLDEGKSIYSMLNVKGKIDEFKETLLSEIKSNLDKDIKSGRLTKEKADEIYKLKESNISSWAEKEPVKLNK